MHGTARPLQWWGHKVCEWAPRTGTVDPTTVALESVRTYGPLALFAFVFLETSLLFPLLPSEVVVPAAAVALVTDPVSLAVFVAAATAGGTLGAYVPYAACYRTRISDANWLERRLRVPDERVERAQAWFRRWGQSSVLWGRFLPVLRSVISVPAGMARMDPRRFGVYTLLGTAAFYAATGGLVYYGRRASVFATAFAVAGRRPSLTALLAVVTVGAAVVLGSWLRDRDT